MLLSGSCWCEAEAAHGAGTDRPSVRRGAVAASARGDTISSQEMGEQSKETQQDGGVCIWPRALPPGGHSLWGQVPVWQTPVLVISGLVHAPAALESPLLIPALHLCPQGIPDPRALPVNTHVSLASSRRCWIPHSWDALCPMGCCSPPLLILCGCLIINNKFLQPCSDIGSHKTSL